MSKVNTDRGKATERMAATWLRGNGFPGAERTVRTGYHTTTRALPDESDIDAAPGVIVQVKSLRPANRAERAIPVWMGEVEHQRACSGADVAVLLVRREGTGDVGEWWTFMTVMRLGELLEIPSIIRSDEPVRLPAAEMFRIIRLCGYGTQTTTGRRM